MTSPMTALLSSELGAGFAPNFSSPSLSLSSPTRLWPTFQFPSLWPAVPGTASAIIPRSPSFVSSTTVPFVSLSLSLSLSDPSGCTVSVAVGVASVVVGGASVAVGVAYITHYVGISST